MKGTTIKEEEMKTMKMDNNSYYNYRREGSGNSNADRGGNLNSYYKPSIGGNIYRKNFNYKQDDEGE
jgi:hypothetical protein